MKDVPKKSSASNSATPAVAPEDPKLPPTGASGNTRRRKVIDLARAVTTIASVPVLDEVKRRMYRDWLRGLRPRSLRIVYGGGGALSVDEVDAVLREEAKRRAVA